jgi:hypothetical protein
MSREALDEVQYVISDFEVFTAGDGIPSIRQRAPRSLPEVAQAVLDALKYVDLVHEVQNLRITVEQDLIYQRGLEAKIAAVLEVHRPSAPECSNLYHDAACCPCAVSYCDACGDPAPCITLRTMEGS